MKDKPAKKPPNENRNQSAGPEWPASSRPNRLSSLHQKGVSTKHRMTDKIKIEAEIKI